MPVAMADIGAAEHAHIDPVDLRMIAAAAFACLRTSLEPVAPGLKTRRDGKRSALQNDQLPPEALDLRSASPAPVSRRRGSWPRAGWRERDRRSRVPSKPTRDRARFAVRG